MNKLNAAAKPAPLAQAVTEKPVAAQPAAEQAAAQVGTRVPSPESRPAIALDTFVSEGVRPGVQAGVRPGVQPGRKPEAVATPARSPGAKIWDGVKKGLFVGTLSAPVVGVAIFGAVLGWAGLASMPAALIGAGAWLAATAGAGALWGSKQP